MPTGSKAKEKSPAAPAVVVRVIPCSEFVSLMVAFGTLAPVGSETVPDNAAVELNDCAWSAGENVSPSAVIAVKTTRSTRRNLVMLPPEICSCCSRFLVDPGALQYRQAGASASHWMEWLADWHPRNTLGRPA